MLRFIAKRLLHMIPLLVGVSLLAFAVMSLAPGDYLSSMRANPQINPDTIEALRVKFGLDRPWYVQYGHWLWSVLHLDFGESFAYHQPVFRIIKTRMFNTFILALSSMVIAWGVAIPLGVISAVKQYSWADRSASFMAFVGLSVPTVLSGLLALLLAAKTGWFPTFGTQAPNYEYLSAFGRIADRLHHLILPSLVLGLSSLAGLMRQMRGSLLEQLRADFVTTARAKGLSERRVVYKHALRNAINPLVTLFGYSLGSLLSGALIVEVIMSWPGLGRLVIDAINQRDQYLYMAALMMAAVMRILGNLAADILLAMVDPRIRYERA